VLVSRKRNCENGDGQITQLHVDCKREGTGQIMGMSQFWIGTISELMSWHFAYMPWSVEYLKGWLVFSVLAKLWFWAGKLRSRSWTCSTKREAAQKRPPPALLQAEPWEAQLQHTPATVVTAIKIQLTSKWRPAKHWAQKTSCVSTLQKIFNKYMINVAADLLKLSFILRWKHNIEMKINQRIKNRVSVSPLCYVTIH
jgi:hypothetical protein